MHHPKYDINSLLFVTDD